MVTSGLLGDMNIRRACIFLLETICLSSDFKRLVIYGLVYFAHGYFNPQVIFQPAEEHNFLLIIFKRNALWPCFHNVLNSSEDRNMKTVVKDAKKRLTV